MKENWTKLFSIGNANAYPEEEVRQVKIEFIKPNPFQPRKEFELIKIDELAQSIKTYGLLQPIILRELSKQEYQIVAGERRFLACKRLGWQTIPAFVRSVNDSAMAAIALIENLQREDLNFIEEAEGYARLIKEFNLTQEVLAQRLGKSQSTIANKLRLLKLPEEIKKWLVEKSLTERHARAFLKIKDREAQSRLLKKVVENNLTVKETEEEVERFLSANANKENKKNRPRKKVVIRDLRIFLNTIRSAVNVIKKSGLVPQVIETDRDDYYEVIIKLPKG
ncbi:MAG: nucleoid occlusion protein [Dethiobacteria bacterium]